MKITTMNISLPGELARYVRDKVEGGQYSSASEVVREALRFLRLDEARGHSLRTLCGGRVNRSKADAAVARIRRLQDKQSLGGDLSIEDLINAGRKA